MEAEEQVEALRAEAEEARSASQGLEERAEAAEGEAQKVCDQLVEAEEQVLGCSSTHSKRFMIRSKGRRSIAGVHSGQQHLQFG